MKSFVVPIVIALLLALAVERTFYYVFEYEFNALINIGVYLTFYFIIAGRIKKAQRDPDDIPVPHPAEAWPRSGPIGKLGPYAIAFTFFPTTMLSMINPWQLVQQLKMIIGMAKVSKRLDADEGYFTNYKTKVNYAYPFAGEWLIVNGGYSEQTSHSWDVFNQRYAFDFVKADPSYSRHSGRGARLTDYHCYNEPILAAADGEVIAVKNGINPAPLVGWGVADFLCLHFAGNHVIVKHADGEYGFYAHLVRDSIPVKIGEQIRQGDRIGLCGHTGHSTEPHLHFHLQDDPDLFNSMGLPIEFNQQRIERGNFVANPQLDSSQPVV